MRYIGVLLTFFFSIPIIYSQKMGVGLDVPTEMLDVQGKIRLRDVKESKAEGLRSLYIRQDGLIGKKEDAVLMTQVYTNVSRQSLPVNTLGSEYNSGKDIIIPIDFAKTENNNLGITQPENTYNLRIATEGYYEYNAFLNLYMQPISSTTNPFFDIIAKIEVSQDNGTSWNVVSGIHFSKMLVAGVFRNAVIILPSGIVKHNAGDLVRMKLARVKDNNGNLTGFSTMESFTLGATNKISPYTIIILKL